MQYERDRTIIIPDLFIIIKLLEEKSKTSTDIQFESRINYSHVYHTKRGMLKHGLINVERIGRRKVMIITVKGRRLLKIVNDYLELFDIKPEDMTSYRRKSEETKRRLQKQEGIKEEKEQYVVVKEEDIKEEIEEQIQEVEQNDNNQSI